MTRRRGRFLKNPPAWGHIRFWTIFAACSPSTADLFYPPNHPETRLARQERERAALAICARCPVRQPCVKLADHLERDTTEPTQVYGIWGGETELERVRRRLAAKSSELGA